MRAQYARNKKSPLAQAKFFCYPSFVMSIAAAHVVCLIGPNVLDRGSKIRRGGYPWRSVAPPAWSTPETLGETSVSGVRGIYV
jgi:hypothetical protein